MRIVRVGDAHRYPRVLCRTQYKSGIEKHMAVHRRKRAILSQYVLQIVKQASRRIKIKDPAAHGEHLLIKKSGFPGRHGKIELESCPVDMSIHVHNKIGHAAGIERAKHVQDTNRLCHTPAPSAAAAKAA